MNKIIKISIYLLIILLLPLLITITSMNQYRIINHDDYTIYQNIIYGGHERNTYDIYIPKINKHNGILLNIHGGAWRAGNKDLLMDQNINFCVNNNVIVVSLNYRYASDTFHANDILDDIRNCLNNAYIFLNEMGINVDQAILTGGSAGGHLAYLYAYKCANDTPIKVKAVIGCAGPTDLTNTDYITFDDVLNIKKLFSYISGVNITFDDLKNDNQTLVDISPITYVNELSVPTIICHGAVDNVVPVSDAYLLDELLTKYNIEHELVIYPHSSHGLESELDLNERNHFNELFKIYIDNYLK